MCRELKREPTWVAAIKLALTKGTLDVEAVVKEANLIPGRERTVEDILTKMTDRELLREVPGSDPPRYVTGPSLYESAPSPAAIKHLSQNGAHRWSRAEGD